MSTIHNGWETWIAYASETNIGTAVSVAAWYLWEGEGADSLDLGYVRYDRNPVSGYRASRSGAYRIGHKLPGGQLPPAPLTMTGSSLPLLYMLRACYQGSSKGGSTWTFTRPEAQIATASFKGLTIVKHTGISGYAERYDGCVGDSWTIAGAHGGFVTLQPTVKALQGTYNFAGGTGSYTPATSGMFRLEDCAVSWQGEAIYPSALSVTVNNNIPDHLGPGANSRTAFSLGAATGEVSITLPRDDSAGTLFMSKYVSPSIGTLLWSGILPSSYGTIAGGGALYWVITAYAVPRPVAHAVQAGELTDTYTMDLVNDGAHSFLVASDASAL